MGKRVIGILMMIFTFIVASMIPAYAANGSTSVTVTLPTFKVALNGVNMDNRYSKYPLIVYKDITYFPMTYSDCRFLGLECNWKGNQEGLLIDATDITAAYCPYKTKERNKSSYKATIPTFLIKINGKLIDNGKEKHPILLFRDITYFPITWQYAVDEFGWDYSFDSHNGLIINSHNIHLLQSAVPNDRAKDTEVMAIADGYVYYLGTNGRIMQSQILPSNNVESQVIYQLPFNSLGDGKSYVLPRLYAEDGKAYLTFHNGGAIMGTDYLFRLNSEGATLINNSRNVRKSFGDKEFQWWVGPAPGPGNLYMKTPDTINSADLTYPGWEKTGSPDYLYGWNWKINDMTGTESASEGGTGSSDCYLISDDLYILAFDTRAAADYLKNGGIKPTTGLYQVNIKTNETRRISNQEVTGFKVEGDYIYYHNRYVELFKYKISEKKEYPITPKLARGNNFIARFEVLGGHIFFESGVDHGLYDSSYETIGRSVRELKLTGSNKEYVVCALSGDNESTERIILFDHTGRKVFRSSDEAYALTVEGNKVYYFNKSTNTICIGDLSRSYPNRSIYTSG
ncbi:MAG: hypothetical protein PHS83_02725 [Clostridia bacterium]|nr:hypothetical protein [Clostridia bacterium]